MRNEKQFAAGGRQRRALLVLGMHRSGTSALTRLVNLLGVELGDKLLPAHADNEKGYWEHEEIFQVDEYILNRLGSRWDDVTLLPEHWPDSPRIRDGRDRLLQILRRDFGDTALWGLKDPRLCRLLPLWKGILRELETEPFFVIALRHPHEVAASLEKRNGFSQTKSLVLWLDHLLQAEEHSRGCPRLFVSYDQLLGDWRACAEKLAPLTRRPVSSLAPEVISQIERFLSPALRHHVATPGAASRETLVADLAEKVYAIFSGAAGGDEARLEELDELRTAYHACHSVLEQEARQCPTEQALREQAAAARKVTRGKYAQWIAKHALTGSDIHYFEERLSSAWSGHPPVHLLTIHEPGREQALADTLDSLSAQLYSGWGLTVISSVASPDPLFEETQNLEWIQWDGNLMEGVNKVAAQSGADWQALIRPGDRLAANALFSCLDYAQLHPQWRLIYVDEDAIDGQGNREDPLFKPDFNLDLLRAMPYMGCFLLVRRDALDVAEGYGMEMPGVYHDLALKVLDACGEKAIGHVPKVLLHCGEHPGEDREKADCRRALEAHLARNGIEAKIRTGPVSGSFFIDYACPRKPPVSIIIPTGGQAAALDGCVTSLLQKTDYPRLELLLVHNGSSEPEAQALLERLAADERVRVLRHPGPFNISAVRNLAAGEARGELLLFLDDDTQVLQGDWLERMVANALRPEVGVVGVRLIGIDQTVQHAGLIAGMAGGIGWPYHHQSLNEPGYMGRLHLAQNCAAVTGSCMLVKKELYEQLGGMDDKAFAVFFGDVDFCMRVGKAGLKVVWTPHVNLLHYGAVSLSANKAVDPKKQADRERAAFIDRWLAELAEDPAHNRNLSLRDLDIKMEDEFDVTWDRSFHSRPRVLAFPLDSKGGGEYRVRAPLRALDAARLAQYSLFSNYSKDRPLQVPMLPELERAGPDSLLLQHSFTDLHLEWLEHYKRHSDTFLVFGLDDNFLFIPGKNASRECFPRNIKYRLRKALSFCDRLVVTTEPLAELYKGMIGDIRVVPNGLESARWLGLESRRGRGRKPRVGWAGAMQHQGDLELIQQVVEALAGEVDWVFMGMCPEALRPHVSEFHGWVPYELYPQKLASLDLDLAIAPLERNSFNECKSNLRLLEYGVLGWPVVCSDVAPYRQGPVTRVPNKASAWIQAIRERIHEPSALAAEGERLRQWVLEHYLLEGHLDLWLGAIFSDAVLARFGLGEARVTGQGVRDAVGSLR